MPTLVCDNYRVEHMEKHNRHIDELITKYLDKSLTREECAELRRYLAEDKKHLAYFAEIRDLWLYNTALWQPVISTRPALEKLKKRIRKYTSLVKIRRTVYYASQIAAVIAIAFIFHTVKESNAYSATTHTVLTSTHKSEVTLPDGTIVWLNNNTKLIYPEVFSLTERSVYLEGEAYFKVTKNKARPFVVKSQGQEIKVLGTSFNVRNRPNEDLAETTLISGAVPSTLEAIYALLEGGTDWLAPDENKTSIVWGGQEMKNSPEEPFLGLTEYTLSGNEISAAAAKAVISTDHEQPSWGAMYWQYYDDVKNVTSASVEDLALSRQIVVRQQGVQSATYVPLNRVTLKTGDRIAIRLTISVGRDMQFVCLTDSRAACFEPTEQLSGYKCRERICYYEEVKNTETRFYFDFLPKGTYVISYELDVDRPGEYTQGLSTIQCLYAPQIIARTPAQTIIIK